MKFLRRNAEQLINASINYYSEAETGLESKEHSTEWHLYECKEVREIRSYMF